MEDLPLRRLIKAKLDDGSLPHQGIPRVWGRRGQGESCTACEAIITEVQLLMEGIGTASGVKFHVKCFHMWDAERREEGHQASGPELPHWPLDELERLAKDKVKRGALFPLSNTKYRAGPATGQLCEVCSQSISRGNECEVRGPKGYVYTHLICHSLWYRASAARGKESIAGKGGDDRSTDRSE